MKRWVFVAVFSLIIGCCPVFSQEVRILSDKGQSVEGAVVTFISLEDNSKSAVVFTNLNGEASVSGITPPVSCTVNRLGFKTHRDTLFQSSSKKLIVLETAGRELGEITVTGAMGPSFSRQSVVPVQVLTRQDIDKRGAVTLRDVLVQELNVRLTNDPALGTSLNLQGTGGEHVKFLVDGVPVIGRQNGNIDLSQINLGNIERIEIVKGPMSVLYGSDALAGVINLITKSPTSQKWVGSLSAFHETTGQYNVEGNAGVSFRSSSFSVNGGRNFFDGWDPASGGVRNQLWNPREQYFAQTKFTHSVKNLRLSLQSSWFNEKVTDRSQPVITPYYAYANDSYYHTLRHNHQFMAEKQLRKDARLSMNAAWSHYRYRKNTLRKNLVDLSEQLTPDVLDDDTVNFNAAFFRGVYNARSRSGQWNLLTGSELNREQGSGRRIDGRTHVIYDMAVFSAVDFVQGNITIRPSIRALYNSRFNAPVIPSLNILWKAGSKWSFRSSASLGYRAPSLKELYLEFVDNGIHNVRGNTQLNPERSRHLSASAEYRNVSQRTVWSVEPTFFLNHIRDQIALVQAVGNSTLYTYRNISRFKAIGGELRTRISMERFGLQGGFAYTGTAGFLDGETEMPSMAWYPEVNASADIKTNGDKTTFTVNWKYTGPRPVFIAGSDEVIGRFNNADFHMLDVSANRKMLKEKITLVIGVRNLLNVTNVRAASGGGVHSGAVADSAPVAMGTSVFTKLTIDLR